MTEQVTPKDVMKKLNEIMEEWECQLCGYCCLNLKIGLKNDDWERWEGIIVKSRIGKYPMRDFCNKKSKKYSKLGDLFFDPVTKTHLNKCPFLNEVKGKFYCLINDPKIKPNSCKAFNEAIVDMRCPHTRNLIQKAFNLTFKTPEEEEKFFKRLDKEIMALHQSKYVFKGFNELLKCISEQESEL